MENNSEIKIPIGAELYDVFKVENEIYLESYKIKTKVTNGFRTENTDYC